MSRCSVHIDLWTFDRVSILLALVSLVMIVYVTPLGAYANSSYQQVFSDVIQYGKQEKALGFVTTRDFPPVGPESFTNDEEGAFYIADTVNHRVHIYGIDGSYVNELQLYDDISPNDIVILQKNIYVYDDTQGQLHQLDTTGLLIHSVNVDKSQWQSRRGLHAVGDEILMTTSDQYDVAIGRIVNNHLQVPPKEYYDQWKKKGILGPSGNRYYVELERLERAIIRVSNQTNPESNRKIKLDSKGIVSIEYLNEDGDNNFYIETERIEGNDVILEIHKFDRTGSHLSTTRIRDNKYDIWTVKLVSIDNKGSIWQLLPKRESATLNIFRQIDK